MGIVITIGEAELRVAPEDEEAPIEAYVVKRGHREAPVEGGDAPLINTRSFTYGGFESWAEAAGLHALFYNPVTGFARQTHPRCELLRPEHLEAVRAARQRPHPEPREDWKHHAPLLAWFEWWMSWALANCKVPAVYVW